MKSNELFARARTMMPGGVSSPVRAISPNPFYVTDAEGAVLRTADGTELIDCCLGYGPLILGHRPDGVKRAIEEQAAKGWLYGTPSPGEIDLAGRIIADHPSVDMLRFVSTGSEATMAAIRLARAATGKRDIIKVEGGFHGAHDAVLVRAGSGATTLGVPDSAGVVADLVAHTRQVPYNSVEALDEVLSSSEDIAALIIEPVMGNIGPILPEDGYLEEVRRITREHDTLLIFDEVITGYRLGIGGAQVMFGIEPDLTTFGKIIGGGLPIGAFGGRKDLMEMVAPQGPVYQAGTFSGNPLTMAAGSAALGWIHDHTEIYGRLSAATAAIADACTDAGAGGSFVRIGSMFKYFFRSEPPQNYLEAKESDTVAFRSFWEGMLGQGVFLPPSQFETNFLSAAHTEAIVERIMDAYRTCL
ncbi:glutamate-1-semialdehyde 2,1-aminomutase [Methanofollis fontis]|uniref:Glutamate-1-semialdehyde 2,1-aminomutase n=1 Tax=Methanofollis fontis TaxID=2052832 RepID=A0A483CU20_9EURY|nr:glutamate-1-semialdehyde 2,1-aminomutase [Methanofollis fontis]TAJ44784.1 glutamate-1-semialdehyde-2,1-aminomutase [Methanofollis fontis]